MRIGCLKRPARRCLVPCPSSPTILEVFVLFVGGEPCCGLTLAPYGRFTRFMIRPICVRKALWLFTSASASGERVASRPMQLVQRHGKLRDLPAPIVEGDAAATSSAAALSLFRPFDSVWKDSFCHAVSMMRRCADQATTSGYRPGGPTASNGSQDRWRA